MTLFNELKVGGRVWNKPPLVFQGNKKNQIKRFCGVLQNLNITPKTVIIDVFGGSGLLSHWAKQLYPQNRVIWNDFDNYAERLAHIDETEAHRRELSELLTKTMALAAAEPTKIPKLTPADDERLRIWIYEKITAGAYVDFLQLSSWFLFSGCYAKGAAEFLKQWRGWRIPQTPLMSAGYLDGVERSQKDYRELLAEWESVDDVCYLLDPPYLQTSAECYSQHFRLADFLECAEYFIAARTAVFFCSESSDAPEFFAWLEKKQGSAGFKTMRGCLSVSKNNTDLMYYKG